MTWLVHHKYTFSLSPPSYSFYPEGYEITERILLSCLYVWVCIWVFVSDFWPTITKKNTHPIVSRFGTMSIGRKASDKFVNWVNPVKKNIIFFFCCWCFSPIFLDILILGHLTLLQLFWYFLWARSTVSQCKMFLNFEKTYKTLEVMI